MLTSDQKNLIRSDLNSKTFLYGPAGCGKTTMGVERMRYLIERGVDGSKILLLTPQRTLQDPYLDYIHSSARKAGSELSTATLSGIARRMIELFWPIVGENAGFSFPNQSPTFLTIETAQYHMARIVRPLLNEGYFDSLTINRNRIYSQIIDNLNKSAAIGFSHKEIGARLSSAWYGDSSQHRVYENAQECANRFRQYCLEHNLLDFSLQIELFNRHLWHQPESREYLTNTYQHLVYDNVEEDFPVAHDIIAEWLPLLKSCLIIYDEGAGFRRFLGADPESAFQFSQLVDQKIHINQSFIADKNILDLEHVLIEKLDTTQNTLDKSGPPRYKDLDVRVNKYVPQMLDGAVGEIKARLDQGCSPSEIVVLAPFLSDALRFSITNRLNTLGIPWRSHRPSRSLRNEPATQCLLTLAALAHPHFRIKPSPFEVAYAFMLAIKGIDLVRSQLLVDIVYRQRDCSLSSFDRIKEDIQERISFILGSRYTSIREWVHSYAQSSPRAFDHFLRSLFSELLSQPGFGFHQNMDAANVTFSLIESFQKFVASMGDGTEPIDQDNISLEYIQLVQDGLIAAQYLSSWKIQSGDMVLISPAYTYLMMNQPVDVQIWLDVGSSGWAERINQPITHPYVLSRAWSTHRSGQLWSDADEVAANQRALKTLISGLLRRCRNKAIFFISDLGEQGYEQRGPLLKSIWRIQMEKQKINS